MYVCIYVVNVQLCIELVQNQLLVNVHLFQHSMAPVPCSKGHYSPAGSTTCMSCPAGYHCANASIAPEICPQGYQSTAMSVSCTACPAGIACPASYDPTLNYPCLEGK